MSYAIFFSCGLGLGLVMGAALAILSNWIAKARAEASFKAELTRLKQDGIVRAQQFEATRKKMLDTFGTGEQMSERHKKVMEEELATVLKAMPPAPMGRR